MASTEYRSAEPCSADTETPLSAYNKLASGPHSYLFESVQGGERWGRYSIIGFPGSRWLTVNGHTLTLFDDGAPKLRAMEIIDELEPVKRGIYGGAVGYVSWVGEMDTAIAIPTALIMDQRVIAQAGAGVVADSIPA